MPATLTTHALPSGQAISKHSKLNDAQESPTEDQYAELNSNAGFCSVVIFDYPWQKGTRTH